MYVLPAVSKEAKRASDPLKQKENHPQSCQSCPLLDYLKLYNICSQLAKAGAEDQNIISSANVKNCSPLRKLFLTFAMVENQSHHASSLPRFRTEVQICGNFHLIKSMG